MAVNGSAENVNGLPYMGTRPQSKPRVQPQERPRVRQQGPKQKAQREQVRKERNRTTNKSKTYNVNVNAGGASGPSGAPMAAQREGIGDLYPSAGGLRQFCERARKLLRGVSNDLAYAEELLRNSLREVAPPPGQGRSAAYMRANRVARSLKRAANATQAASAHCSRTWLAYTREYERELSEFGGPRMQPRRGHEFGS